MPSAHVASRPPQFVRFPGFSFPVVLIVLKISHTTTPPYNGLGVHNRSAQPHHPSMMSILKLAQCFLFITNFSCFLVIRLGPLIVTLRRLPALCLGASTLPRSRTNLLWQPPLAAQWNSIFLTKVSKSFTGSTRRLPLLYPTKITISHLTSTRLLL
jgi:hypothetical protein